MAEARGAIFDTFRDKRDVFSIILDPKSLFCAHITHGGPHLFVKIYMKIISIALKRLVLSRYGLLLN